MLQGGKETIRKHKPKLAITTYHKAKNADEIYDYIKSIDSSYNIKLKGIQVKRGSYMMLQTWHGKY